MRRSSVAAALLGVTLATSARAEDGGAVSPNAERPTAAIQRAVDGDRTGAYNAASALAADTAASDPETAAAAQALMDETRPEVALLVIHVMGPPTDAVRFVVGGTEVPVERPFALEVGVHAISVRGRRSDAATDEELYAAKATLKLGQTREVTLDPRPPDACWQESVCKEYGNCTSAGGACVAASIVDCEHAGRCKDFGPCRLDDVERRCIPTRPVERHHPIAAQDADRVDRDCSVGDAFVFPGVECALTVYGEIRLGAGGSSDAVRGGWHDPAFAGAIELGVLFDLGDRSGVALGPALGAGTVLRTDQPQLASLEALARVRAWLPGADLTWDTSLGPAMAIEPDTGAVQAGFHFQTGPTIHGVVGLTLGYDLLGPELEHRVTGGVVVGVGGLGYLICALGIPRDCRR